ncbi:MAG: DUF4258 domain-containing protein [Deltaproteobacteria bacterium]|nr:DUF4258 domain-containing protein [Deltaproteobacteria bacterium]
MKPVRISNHARLQMYLRGALEEEVVKSIQLGEWKPAKTGKFQSKWRFNFNLTAPANQRFYKYKTVESIFAEEPDEIVIITVKVYYSNEEVIS